MRWHFKIVLDQCSLWLLGVIMLRLHIVVLLSGVQEQMAKYVWCNPGSLCQDLCPCVYSIHVPQPASYPQHMQTVHDNSAFKNHLDLVWFYVNIGILYENHLRFLILHLFPRGCLFLCMFSCVDLFELCELLLVRVMLSCDLKRLMWHCTVALGSHSVVICCGAW